MQVHNLDMYVHSKKSARPYESEISLFFCFFSGWKVEFGGFTSYIAHDEDEEVSGVMFSLE